MHNCEALSIIVNQPIRNWNVSKVINMNKMFKGWYLQKLQK